ncbi:hypothetical protein [Kribbella sp. NPDC004875]|uniref:hypothetical protein n=1 Tax=Kribbella sp. NPDC004875 TaxID=3364107 RepID=UPI0036B75C38
MSDGNGSPPAVPARATARDTPTWATKARPVVDVSARIACLVLGGALLVAGIVGLFTGVSEGQLVTVVAAGLLLLVMPSIVDRIRSMKLGAFEVDLLRQMAETAKHAAETLERLGMGPELSAYATIYSELRDEQLTPLRGQLMDRILRRVANAAAVEKFDKDEVRDLFVTGSPVVRVLALGLMEGDRSLIDSDVLLEAIRGPLSGNEQYHALKLAYDGWGRLTPADRNQLLAALDHNPKLQMGPDRIAVAQQIRELDANSRIR